MKSDRALKSLAGRASTDLRVQAVPFVKLNVLNLQIKLILSNQDT